MEEKFVKPAVGAIIEKKIEGETFILIQERQKENGGAENGLLEIPAGKIREYENIFTALRREVMEETGLTITKIHGEEKSKEYIVNSNKVINIEPYCISQNLSGVYSILLSTFLCEAEGTLAKETNETQNIRWERADKVKDLLISNQRQLFLMHIPALRKYFGL